MQGWIGSQKFGEIFFLKDSILYFTIQNAKNMLITQISFLLQ
jgi:hypothetical protein